MDLPTVSLVVPAYNEERNIPAFSRRSSPSSSGIGETFEIVFVNDGSRDGTLGMLLPRRSQDPRIKVVGLARNFGKDVALSAGLAHATRPGGHSDRLRPPAPARADPAVRREVARGLRHGARRAQQARRGRLGPPQRVARYYKVMRWMTSVEIPPNAGDYRLIDRKIVDVINQMPERHRFMKGIFAWPGFKVAIDRVPGDVRANDARRWSFFKLWRFALDGMFSFSTAPLKLWTYVGLAHRGGVVRLPRRHAGPEGVLRHRRPGYASLLDRDPVLQRPGADLERHPGRVHRAHLRGGEGPPALRRRRPLGLRRRRAGRAADAGPARHPGAVEQTAWRGRTPLVDGAPLAATVS